MSKRDDTNEWGDSASSRRQWTERPMKPTIKKVMPTEEVEFFRRALVASYGCKDEDIFVKYKKLSDKYNYEDENVSGVTKGVNSSNDMNDFMMLKYKHRCIRDGLPLVYTAFRCKILIPENVKKQYKQRIAQITM
jgi:hypothetical protein